MKLVSRGDTTVVDAYLSPILRRYVDQVAREIGNTRTRLMFMQSSGGLTDAGQVPGQGQHPVRPGRRHRRRGGDGAPRRVRPHHRLRHGRHLDRRVALERRLRAHLRCAGRRRARARADDADPHGGGGRRLDPAFRRRALPRRPGFGRRQSRPGQLSPRRAAHRDRLQRDAGQAQSRFLPAHLRARRRPEAGPRDRRGEVRSAGWGNLASHAARRSRRKKRRRAS